MTVVLDASMTIAWLFDDERTEAAHQVMLHIVANGAIRRKRCDEDFVNRSLGRLKRFKIGIDDETDLHAWDTTRTLSREQNLTIYDAAYLELALRKMLPLASCDGDLVAAARRCTVEVLTA